jgi:hypothetical protein
MNILPGLIGGLAAAGAVHASTGNENTTAVAFFAGFLVTEFMTRAARRGLTGSSAGFWQTTVGRWLIGRMAGGAVYAALAGALWYPAVYAVGYSFGIFGQIAGWNAAVAVWPALPWLIWPVVSGAHGSCARRPRF